MSEVFPSSSVTFRRVTDVFKTVLVVSMQNDESYSLEALRRDVMLMVTNAMVRIIISAVVLCKGKVELARIGAHKNTVEEEEEISALNWNSELRSICKYETTI